MILGVSQLFLLIVYEPDLYKIIWAAILTISLLMMMFAGSKIRSKDSFYIKVFLMWTSVVLVCFLQLMIFLIKN